MLTFIPITGSGMRQFTEDFKRGADLLSVAHEDKEKRPGQTSETLI